MEELKYVAEILNTLGTEAKGAFVIWTLCKYALPSLVTVFLVSLIIVIGRKFLDLFFLELKFNEEICRIMSFDKGTLEEWEKEEILKTLRKAKER